MYMKPLFIMLGLSLVIAVSSAQLNAQSNRPFGATNMDQSTYAMGSMRWNVVFVQGDGTEQTQRETWTAGEIANVQTKVSDAANYWEGLTSGFHQNARLSIDVNYVNGNQPLLTGKEPSTNTQETWVNDVMGTLGYNGANRFNNVRDFNNDQRDAGGTHWAATVFIMDNTEANLSSYAYAYHGGPYTILTHNAAGWTPDNFHMVLAHEMGHIFFAHDEYAASGRTVLDRGGYLNVENGNASRDANGNIITPPQPNALMRNNGNFNTGQIFDPSVFASDQFGHRDTDGDLIPDILDTTPTLTGNDTGSSGSDFVFDGSVVVDPIDNQNPLNINFSNSQIDMTINTIASAFYTLDGSGPIALSTLDGAFGDYTESLGFTLSGLAGGDHLIEVFSMNSVDNMSNVLTFNFTAVPEPSGLVVLAMMSGLWLRRRRSA